MIKGKRHLLPHQRSNAGVGLNYRRKEVLRRTRRKPPPASISSSEKLNRQESGWLTSGKGDEVLISPRFRSCRPGTQFLAVRHDKPRAFRQRPYNSGRGGTALPFHSPFQHDGALVGVGGDCGWNIDYHRCACCCLSCFKARSTSRTLSGARSTGSSRRQT
jgi:hypothetical protein